MAELHPGFLCVRCGRDLGRCIGCGAGFIDWYLYRRLNMEKASKTKEVDQWFEKAVRDAAVTSEEASKTEEKRCLPTSPSR